MSDGSGSLAPPRASRMEKPTGKRLKRGAIQQVVLFTAVWSMLVSVLGLPIMLPSYIASLAGPDGTTGGTPGSTSVWWLSDERLLALVGAATETPLAMVAASTLGTLLSVWIMWRWFDGPALPDLGMRCRPGWLLDTLVGLVLGPPIFLVVLVVLLVAGWAHVTPGTIDGRGLVVAVVTFALVAISEEIFARGWVLQVLERGRGTRVAVIGSSAIFSLLHGLNPNIGPLALVILFLAGLLFAQAYLATRQLWLPIALHLSWNFSEGPLFGFPVSGMPGGGLLTTIPTGPELATGGPFGPEAGLVLVAGIALGGAALLWYGRRRRASRGDRSHGIAARS